jgi:hypothetical protein
MTVDEFQLRRVAVCASGLVYWGGVLIQGRRVRRRIGRSPNLRPRGSREKALWFGWALVVLAWIGQPWAVDLSGSRPGLTLYPPLVHPAGLAAGLALLVLGYAGTLWSYAAMGQTWRIGIDTREKTTLVSHGPYRWVRHPIYALQMVMLAGAALLLPTAVSFAIFAIHFLCVLVKSGDEEKYLASVHGPAYREYQSRTGGLFPRVLGKPSEPARGARGID